MKRITIEVTEQQQHRLKAMAALQGQSIKDFVPLARSEQATKPQLEELSSPRATLGERREA